MPSLGHAATLLWLALAVMGTASFADTEKFLAEYELGKFRAHGARESEIDVTHRARGTIYVLRLRISAAAGIISVTNDAPIINWLRTHMHSNLSTPDSQFVRATFAAISAVAHEGGYKDYPTLASVSSEGDDVSSAQQIPGALFVASMPLSSLRVCLDDSWFTAPFPVHETAWSYAASSLKRGLAHVPLTLPLCLHAELHHAFDGSLRDFSSTNRLPDVDTMVFMYGMFQTQLLYLANKNLVFADCHPGNYLYRRVQLAARGPVLEFGMLDFAASASEPSIADDTDSCAASNSRTCAGQLPLPAQFFRGVGETMELLLQACGQATCRFVQRFARHESSTRAQLRNGTVSTAAYFDIVLAAFSAEMPGAVSNELRNSFLSRVGPAIGLNYLWSQLAEMNATHIKEVATRVKEIDRLESAVATNAEEIDRLKRADATRAMEIDRLKSADATRAKETDSQLVLFGMFLTLVTVIVLVRSR
eukprot:m.241193 g.241193  ORF g.241193 m.241193 type:complete len:477 (+) comp13803_c0_seq1:168-1598(+)